MIREDRYLVLKWNDIYDFLSEDQRYLLEKMISKIAVNRVKLNKEAEPEFVCVRSTWPEYELVREMIEKRVDSENTIHS